MRKFTAVSMLGDKTYRKALRELSERRDMHIGVVVRNALDQVHGEELQRLVSFFEQADQQIRQSDKPKVKETKQS